MADATLRLGMTLPQFTDDPRRLLDVVCRAEAAGMDSVWLFDHLWPLSGGKERPILEQWTTLAFLAARTERVGLGTLVTRSSLRHPALLAKMAATVACVAPGRLTVTLGSGDRLNEDENRSIGAPFWPFVERAAQVTSVALVLRQWFAGPQVSLTNDHVDVTDLPPSPRPPSAPALWIAGNTTSMAQTAGRVADGWNAWGLEPERFRRRVFRLRGSAAGRAVEPTWGGIVDLVPDGGSSSASGEPHVSGDPDAVAAYLHPLVDAGATHLIATFPNASAPGVLEAWAAEVRARLVSRTS